MGECVQTGITERGTHYRLQCVRDSEACVGGTSLPRVGAVVVEEVFIPTEAVGADGSVRCQLS